MKLAHTMIRVADVEKSLKFYKEILGMKLKKTMELKGATLYFLTDEAEAYFIELTYNHEPPAEPYSHGTYFGHFAFETDNIDAFSEKLKSTGLEYTKEPFYVKEGGPKIAFLNDPDGYSIEIIQW